MLVIVTNCDSRSGFSVGNTVKEKSADILSELRSDNLYGIEYEILVGACIMKPTVVCYRTAVGYYHTRTLIRKRKYSKRASKGFSKHPDSLASAQYRRSAVA